MSSFKDVFIEFVVDLGMCMSWLGFGAILITQPGINSIHGWDAFSHSTAAVTNDQCQ